MDNHPIPQDVTGFQFKLIGNMSVKQFAYLATGVVLAGILYKSPLHMLIKLPFCVFFIGFGAGLAYFPISGRPMDAMIGSYIKALFRPTQFIYGKVGGQIYFPNKAPVAVMKNVQHYNADLGLLPKDKLKAYLSTFDNGPKNVVDERENNFLMSVSSLTANNPYQPENVSPVSSPQPMLQTNPITSAYLQSNIHTPTNPPAQAQEKPIAQQPAVPAQSIQQVAQNIQAVQPMKQETPQPVTPQPQFRPIVKGVGRNIGAPSIPDSPSIITGVTKDSRGNPLSNILVEVKDKDGNPVRAFKTNELGRFASATPLTNGAYSIEFEDPKAQNRFGKLAINVTGQIIMPIEAISVDTREELRMSLFASNQQAN